MAKESRSIFSVCLGYLFKPIARFCLKHSVTVSEVIETYKLALVEVAEEELRKESQKINVSRLSVASGLNRKEVLRIWREGETRTPAPGYISRVIGQWEQDPKFRTKARRPRVLTYQSDDSEFHELVRLVCTDVHPGTVLFELKRLGIVEFTKDGVRLVSLGYLPEGDLKEAFRLLSKDLLHLIEGAEDNVMDKNATPELHVRTEYDNISVKDLQKIRKWLYTQGSSLHKKARKFISQYDLDINPKQSKEGGGKVVIGTFGRVLGK